MASKEQLQPPVKETVSQNSQLDGEINWTSISAALSGSMFSSTPDAVGPAMEHAFSFSRRRKESQKRKTSRKK